MSITTVAWKRANLATDLRALADYLERHPEVPVPSGTSLRVHVSSDEFVAAARAMKGDVDVEGKYVVCRRAFGSMVLGVQTFWRDVLDWKQEPDPSDQVRELLEQAA